MQRGGAAASSLVYQERKSGMEKVTEYSTVVQLLERKKSDGERGKIDENRDITGHAFPTWFVPVVLVVLVVATGTILVRRTQLTTKNQATFSGSRRWIGGRRAAVGICLGQYCRSMSV